MGDDNELKVLQVSAGIHDAPEKACQISRIHCVQFDGGVISIRNWCGQR